MEAMPHGCHGFKCPLLLCWFRCDMQFPSVTGSVFPAPEPVFSWGCALAWGTGGHIPPSSQGLLVAGLAPYPSVSQTPLLEGPPFTAIECSKLGEAEGVFSIAWQLQSCHSRTLGSCFQGPWRQDWWRRALLATGCASEVFRSRVLDGHLLCHST